MCAHIHKKMALKIKDVLIVELSDPRQTFNLSNTLLKPNEPHTTTF